MERESIPKMPAEPLWQPEEALAHWRGESLVGGAEILPEPDAGLINRTWRVGSPPRAILQWVNPIFDPLIHQDIAAISAHLKKAGVEVPHLVPTPLGDLCLPEECGTWRLLSYLPGCTLHRLESEEQAAEAGALVGRFHATLADFQYRFHAPQRRIHVTPARMEELRATLKEIVEHPLLEDARDCGEEILGLWGEWEGRQDGPERICHGDLKISNLRFDEEGRARALLDLDTLGPMDLGAELGDAWRSWCNPAGEDPGQEIVFRRDLFAASARAWRSHGPQLANSELLTLVPGIERICLELASRFCADALRNSYFREDRERFPQAGKHNLRRAQGQVALARSARAARGFCAEVLGI